MLLQVTGIFIFVAVFAIATLREGPPRRPDVPRRVWRGSVAGRDDASGRGRGLSGQHHGAAGGCHLSLRHRPGQRHDRSPDRGGSGRRGGQRGHPALGVLRPHRRRVRDGLAAGRTGDGSDRHADRQAVRDGPHADGPGDRQRLQRGGLRSHQPVRHRELRNRAPGQHRAQPTHALRRRRRRQSRAADRRVPDLRRLRRSGRAVAIGSIRSPVSARGSASRSKRNQIATIVCLVGLVVAVDRRRPSPVSSRTSGCSASRSAPC